MNKIISAKIAEIINKTKIAINKGYKDGVKKGMEFIIYNEGAPIYDPSTKEQLGKVEIVKGRVVVSHVQEKISIAETPKYSVSTLNTFANLQGLFTTERQDELVLEDQQFKEIELKMRRAMVGDLVRSVPEDDK